MARTADVVIMMLDATKGEVQRSAEWDRGKLACLGRPLSAAAGHWLQLMSLSSWWTVRGALALSHVGVVAGLSTG